MVSEEGIKRMKATVQFCCFQFSGFSGPTQWSPQMACGPFRARHFKGAGGVAAEFRRKECSLDGNALAQDWSFRYLQMLDTFDVFDMSGIQSANHVQCI